MRVLLTGATGFIGSAVLGRLLEGGHAVTALVRTEEGADAVRRSGAAPLRGDLRDPESFREAIAASEGTIHAGSPGDQTSAEIDRIFVETALGALAGSSRPLIYTSGIWVYGDTQNLSEDSPFAPIPMVAWRPAVAERVRTAEGVRGIVVAPGSVHGDGNGAYSVLAGEDPSGDHSALLTVGSGQQHIAAVHVADLADLYIRALESAPAGSNFIAVSGDNPTAYEITEALSRARGLDGRVDTETTQETLARLGDAFGAAMLLDQQGDGATARATLGWDPSGPTLIEEISARRAAS